MQVKQLTALILSISKVLYDLKSPCHCCLVTQPDFSRPHEPQHSRPPCPSPTPELVQTHVH